MERSETKQARGKVFLEKIKMEYEQIQQEIKNVFPSTCTVIQKDRLYIGVSYSNNGHEWGQISINGSEYMLMFVKDYHKTETTVKRTDEILDFFSKFIEIDKTRQLSLF